MDQASLLLRKQLKGWAVCCDTVLSSGTWTCYNIKLSCADLTKRPVEGFSAGLVDDSSLFEWAVTIMGPPDTL